MKVFDMTKGDFDKVPERGGFSEDIGEFDSLVIIPQDYAHDSGWMCRDFVAVNKNEEPICRLSRTTTPRESPKHSDINVSATAGQLM